MRNCPFCHAPTPDLARHYGRECIALIGAFDPLPDRSTRRPPERVRDAEYEWQKGEQRRRNAKSYRARKAGSV